MNGAFWATQTLPPAAAETVSNLIKPKWLVDAKDRTKRQVWSLFTEGERCIDLGKPHEAIERFKEAYRIAAKVSEPNPNRDTVDYHCLRGYSYRPSCSRVSVRRTTTSHRRPSS